MKINLIRFLNILQLFLLSFLLAGCFLFPEDTDPDAEEKVKYVLGELYVPETAVTDVGLLSEVALYPEVSIVWESLNPDIITSEGKFLKNGNATLRADVRCGSYHETRDFNLTLNSDLTLNYINETNYDLFVLKNAEVLTAGAEKKIALKAAQGLTGSIELKEDVINPAFLSFDFQLTNNDSLEYTELEISYSKNQGESWNLFFVHNFREAEATDSLSFDLSSITGSARFRISLVTGGATEKNLCLSNISFERFLSEDDVLASLQERLPKNVTATFVLPKTTRYGGIVSWESSDSSLIDEKGFVKAVSGNAQVTLTATVFGFKNPIVSAYEIVIGEASNVDPVEIFFVDIGKYGTNDTGEAIYIKIADFDILIDSGQYEYSFRALQEVIENNSNDQVIDYLFATHPDADHIGNMVRVFNKYQILNVVQFYGEHTSQTYRDYKAAVARENLISECTVTDSVKNQNGCSKNIEISDGVSIEILDTKNYTQKETNERSIVFVLEAYGTRLLFTGDSDTIEKDYMNDVGNIDILKAAHHGSKYGTSAAFLSAVDPEVVIITNGNYFGNKYGHPSWEAINRIYAYDSQIEIYAVVGGDAESCSLKSGNYTCSPKDMLAERNGTLKITVDASGYQISSEYQKVPIELSDTGFWKTHPRAEYFHNG